MFFNRIFMKKLRKLKLKDIAILGKDEMRALLGGAYYCSRSKQMGDNSFITYTFTSEDMNVANSWCAFWKSAGWFVTLNVKNDNDQQKTDYYGKYL